MAESPTADHRASIKWLIASGVGLIVVVVAACCVLVIQFRDNALRNAHRELRSMALVLAEHTDRSLVALDIIQSEIEERLQSFGIETPGEFNRRMPQQDIHIMLGDKVSGLTYLQGVSLFSLDGTLLNFSRFWPVPNVNVADRPYFREIVGDLSKNLAISEPLHDRVSNQTSIYFARRIYSRGGQVLGVVNGSILADRIEELFARLSLAPQSTISLFRRDGILLVRQPGIDGTIGKKFPMLGSILSAKGNDLLRLKSSMDGEERILAAHPLADYPLVIVTSNTVESALASWRQETKSLIVLSAIAVFGVGVIVVFVTRRILTDVRRSERLLDEQKRQLDTAIGNMSQGLVMFDEQEKVVLCNDQYIKMYGLSPDVIKPGCSLAELVEHRREKGAFNKDAERYSPEGMAAIVAKLRAGQMLENFFEMSDGRTMRVINQPLPEGGWIATHEDITRQRTAEIELENTRNFFKTVIEHVPASIFVKDAKTMRYVLLNQAGQRFFGRTAEDVIGKHVRDIFPKEAADIMERRDAELLATGHQRFENDAPLHATRNGMTHITTDRIVIPGIDGQPKYLLGVITDISELKRSEAQILYLAQHDALTGLANRALFLERINESLARLRRHQQAFNVFVLDLDYFKAVNDSLGHPVGDALLKEVAARLRSGTRETDIVARLGGDEFAILQPVDGDARHEAQALAERLLAEIGRPYELEGHTVTAGTSIGIAVAPDDGTDADRLMKNADLALYKAKSSGRNIHCFFETELETQALSRHVLENELRDALARNEFALFYQTIVDARTREVCAAEALVRWRHPRLGLVSPDQFIPLAEETGLILAMGEWILKTACRDAVAWPEHIKVAVNLSVAQFKRSDLIGVVSSALSQSGLAPERLQLEVTESVLLQKEEIHLDTLKRLQDMGVSIVLDDFGTGYSSLSYIRMFPFNKIKIDRSFVSELSNRADCAAIICAITSLGEGLQIRTTAEGVETEEQVTLLRAAGVDELQGFLFSRPCPVNKLCFEAPDTMRSDGKAA